MLAIFWKTGRMSGDFALGGAGSVLIFPPRELLSYNGLQERDTDMNASGGFISGVNRSPHGITEIPVVPPLMSMNGSLGYAEHCAAALGSSISPVTSNRSLENMCEGFGFRPVVPVG